MYVSRYEVRVEDGLEDGFRAMNEALHAGMASVPGFRWAMLLRSLEDPSRLASVSMWQSPQLAQAFKDGEAAAAVYAAHPVLDAVAPVAPAQDYDVATARGSMTPARFVALVDWQVGPAVEKDFTGRWNAAFHSIEDKLGSRLLKDLAEPETQTGLHSTQDAANLDAGLLAGRVRDNGGLGLEPASVGRFEVLLLTEA
jgi:heme-degrading monooxygenase HmoA